MEPRMKNLIEVSVDSIRIHMPTAQHLVILKEKEADRYLPIWIGSFEAQAIATKISGNALGRPLTHDLMATAFGDLGVSIKRIVVTRLADQVFYARLYVKQNGRDLDFDARPSDAIALAVRVECPIFVASEVMDSAGSCMFTGLGLIPTFGAPVDPTRIAAQIVTGVGFLGAGSILRQGEEVKGLTTAASIWVAASLGMAVGFGYYGVAVFTTVLVVVILVALKPMEERVFPLRRNRRRDDPRPAGIPPE